MSVLVSPFGPSTASSGGTSGTESYTVTNPGAETGDMTGWTAETGTGFETLVSADVPGLDPRTGTYFFGADNQLTARSYQDVTAATGSITTTLIDAGKLLVKLTYYAASFADDDQVRMYCTFLDGADAPISTDYDLGNLAAGPAGSWEKRELFAVAPANTRKIRIHMHGYRTDGTYNNAHIDDISLTGYLIG